MELESAAAFGESVYLRDDRRNAFLPAEYIPLLADGISFIFSRCVTIQEIVANITNGDYCIGMAEHLRLTCGKVKHELVEKMAAHILAFFLQPEAINEAPCSLAHLQYVLHELMRIIFRRGYLIGQVPSLMEAADKLFNLYQDLLQGKYDSVEKLRNTITWIGEDEMEKLRTSEEVDLMATHKANKRRRISNRQRMKYRTYFV